MLQLILQEIELAGGTINLADLSRQLDVDPGALEGMLEFWVRKGRLRNSNQGGKSCSTGAACGGSVRGSAGMPLCHPDAAHLFTCHRTRLAIQ